MDKTGQTFKSEANKTAKSKMTNGLSEKNQSNKVSDKMVTKTSEMAKSSRRAEAAAKRVEEVKEEIASA